ncbi:MAG TPA: saccharopine dehydrogenase C-terminal domain-containing protein [Gemmatimonadales bacterium]|jgi:lysine 6-dehydrogenase|nr:saccharopine dehydrogenase C-terminal domain-containing protein [Gemmatimonadales bacterium]
MRMLVLGAGLQGSACAYDLLQRPEVARVTLADLDPKRRAPFLKAQASKRLAVARLDATQGARLRRLLHGHDAVLNALPYYFNYPVAKAAVAAGLHCADLGGNTEIVQRQKGLHAAASKKAVSVVPDCGLAPGMVNILAAEGIRRVGDADTVKIFVGGLPQHPEPPLNYQIVYSLEGALDYYTTPSWVLRDGRPARVDALTEIEPVEFPPPVGFLEAFHTGGGISTLPWAYAGKVRTMEYKTLRYPGHVAIMRSIRDLGLLDLKPVVVKGTKVAPRDAFIAAVSPKLTKPDGRDLVALRVEVKGRSGRRVAWQLLDYYDEASGISAMMRTTGYSLAITGVMQVDGRITAKGVHTPDEAVPFGAYVDELKKRGVEIREVSKGDGRTE